MVYSYIGVNHLINDQHYKLARLLDIKPLDIRFLKDLGAREFATEYDSDKMTTCLESYYRIIRISVISFSAVKRKSTSNLFCRMLMRNGCHEE